MKSGFFTGDSGSGHFDLLTAVPLWSKFVLSFAFRPQYSIYHTLVNVDIFSFYHGLSILGEFNVLRVFGRFTNILGVMSVCK